jgi:K+-sensing histidine kinase KdpD
MSDGAITVAEFQALFRLRDVLQSAALHDEILEAVCDAVETVLGVRRVSLQVFSPEGHTRFQASRGLSHAYRRLIEERWRSIFDPQQPRTFVSPHLEGDDREPLWREIVAEGIGALISVPLLAHGKLLGKMVAYHGEPHAFTRHEIELAEIIANVAAIAIARHLSDEAREQSLEELREAQTELKAYHDLVTHDVTNHAGALTGILDYVLKSADATLGAELRGLLRRAKRQVFQLTQLAQNAKTLSRIREKGLAPAGSPVRLRERMESMVETVRDAHFDRPLQAEMTCPAELQVQGIPFLDNIFLNLFDNIVRHTPGTRGPRVRIVAAPEGDRVRVIIRGGAPPDEELLAHLFERYRPGGRSSGSGMGLALIREIVARAGGDVRVGLAGEPEGEVFEVVVTLPAAKG